MHQNLEWFTDRIGSHILRGNVEFLIKDKAMAEKLYKLQGDGYEFTAKVRVHRARPESCLACEG